MTTTAPTTDSFAVRLSTYQNRLHAVLPGLLAAGDSELCDADARSQLARLFEACEYSLMNGGKRVRPALVYATAEALSASVSDRALDICAGALEMIHAYSLVHDDLPAMDNDDLRRGKPTCHIAFDEATAILVGDGLQSRAFELLTSLPLAAECSLRIIRLVAAASGPRGMVGGQAIDLAAINQQINLQQLQTMHQLKTGALIRSAIGIAALACGASDDQRRSLDTYGAAIGLAFQVQDDILDIESSTETLGKTQGADIALNKPTFPAFLGLDGAKQLARQLHEQALAALSDFDHSAESLRLLASYIIERRH
ncbi:polyprenyl synthetase family protein [Spongiibacter sp. KMU-166]|uniref:Polyprenyl synthetase family protein n=1 Tax=Spongiibacter thalassae TaxID=2721624 RepID=A0ABX1GFT2_9GAMM|nr:farnesyl diphosphate synthase [Spongiibacter thalassae]NKI18080.1 polyprenyl synthetase family protein [Spongiibacter thalassae]